MIVAPVPFRAGKLTEAGQPFMPVENMSRDASAPRAAGQQGSRSVGSLVMLWLGQNDARRPCRLARAYFDNLRRFARTFLR
jgi:hypothetical protein